MTGLFPPVNPEAIFDPPINWQPIPVHTTPQALDDLLLPYDSLLVLTTFHSFSRSILQTAGRTSRL